MQSFRLIGSISRLVLFLAIVTGAIHADEISRPNILILLGDDIDRDTLGPWGGEAMTPHLDKLAADGIRFDNIYANVAMCAPFRQELYSGRTVWRTRAMPNHSRSVKGTKSLPHYLRPLGYRVGLLGKSHIGPKECYPFDRLGDLPKKEDANPLALKVAHDYIAEARDAGDPFCLVIASHDGHGPYTNGDPSAYDEPTLSLDADTIDTPIYRKDLARHFAEITHLDALLGQLRDLLAKEKLTDNTLVLFCSEQGNAFPFGKWTCFNDGLASGVVAALPGKIPAGTSCSQLSWIADIVPSLVEAARGEIAEGDFDGKSQWSNFVGGDESIHEYAYGAFINCNIIDNRKRIFPIRSIRDKRYSLIWSPRGTSEITSNTTLSQALEWIEAGEKTKGETNTAGSWVLAAKKSNSKADVAIVKRLHHRPEWALYDRESDTEELTNLISDPKAAPVLERMRGELKIWLESWGDADPVATEESFVKRR